MQISNIKITNKNLPGDSKYEKKNLWNQDTNLTFKKKNSEYETYFDDIQRVQNKNQVHVIYKHQTKNVIRTTNSQYETLKQE